MSGRADTAPEVAIKTMNLYNNIDRIKNELRELNLMIDEESSLDIKSIMKLLCLNYTGMSGCENAIRALQLKDSDTLLDIGCGVGGPSLYIASEVGCKIFAVDLQESNIDNLKYFSKRCGLDSLIQPMCCNVTDLEISPEQQIGGMLSILTILHIPLAARRAIFNHVFSLLKPDGRIYIEDYYKHSDFTERESELLAKQVYCTELPTEAEYKSMLSDCGFEDLHIEDKTGEWSVFTRQRLATFEADRARFEQVHNEATFSSLQEFYSATCELLQGGRLGAGVITATKPL